MLSKSTRVLRRVLGTDCYEADLSDVAWAETVLRLYESQPELSDDSVIVIHIIDGHQAETILDAFDQTLSEVFKLEAESM